ncbi:MAG: sugar ABC transporter ATP-binding protein [Opitutaceae bacterium]|nr:sugar ABC transporter ATP-binding protein [Opitutaceae bacterium]
MADDVPLLHFRRITKRFAGVTALHEVNFELRAGEVHALLGENGAGKSTLIKLATGVHQPDGGGLELNGQLCPQLSPAKARALGVACIYQQPALCPDLSVAENIALRLESGGAWRRVDWRARRRRTAELLNRVGASLDPERTAGELSMPEQQLVEIACAVGAGARIVIMDEPTAALTGREQELLHRIVRDLRDAGTGIIYITHRLEEIAALADRVTVLRDGQAVGTCNAAEVGEAELIKMMVGREVTRLYPPREGDPGETLLAVRGLGCRRGGVRDVSLQLRAGEILGLAGLVGAGRTELARVLFGLTPADAGEIVLNGNAVRIASPQDAVAQGIAYVPEDRRRHGVIPELAVAENMSLASHRRMFPGAWLRPRRERSFALDYMQRLAVKADGPEAPVATLSGGNQQKVALARWLATEPRVLILDEPTQGVDVGAKSEIHRQMRALAAQGMALLLISSDLPEVLGLSDRIGVMRNGRLVATLPGGASATAVMAAALGRDETKEGAA